MQKKTHSFKDTVICYKDTWVNIKESEHGIDSLIIFLSLVLTSSHLLKGDNCTLLWKIPQPARFLGIICAR